MNNVTEDLKKLSEGDIVPKRALEGIAGKLLLLVVTSLIAIGIIAVYTGSSSWGEKFLNKGAEHFLFRQLLFIVIGIVIIFFTGKIDYQKLKNVSGFIFSMSLIGLLSLLIFKAFGVIKGPARWINIGVFSFQISEFSKYAMILFLASFASKHVENIDDFYKGFVPMGIAVASTAVLIALEPNFSTAAIIMCIGFVIMFIAGTRYKYLILTALGFLAAGLIFLFQAEYRVKRVLSFIGMGSSSMTHQLDQALIGFGSGGLFGVGIGESMQREFLPLSYNDFIFAIIGEEVGFVGAMLIILLYVLIFICGIAIAKEASELFGKLLAISITFSISFYAVINMAVVSGLLPTTGIVLPFVSYGGSAMIAHSFGVGILISISRQEKKKREMLLQNQNSLPTDEVDDQGISNDQVNKSYAQEIK